MRNGASRPPVTLLTDDQDVVQLLHAVNLRQKLVDHRVMHACAAGARASLLADGVQLVEDDDMEPAVGSQLGTDRWSLKTDQFGLVISTNPQKHALTLFCSSSASANSLRMLASDSPTYLLRISGPLTTFGSRALSILPICLAIRVLPQPGGPNSKIPFTCLQPGMQKKARWKGGIKNKRQNEMEGKSEMGEMKSVRRMREEREGRKSGKRRDRAEEEGETLARLVIKINVLKARGSRKQVNKMSHKTNE